LTRRLVPANPRSNAKIETLALNLIRCYQPAVLSHGEQFDIERFFDVYLEELTGVETDYQRLEVGIYGYTDSDEMVCVISQDLAEDPWSKYFYRSTMAHETGHALMHVSDYRQKKAIIRSIHKKDHGNLRTYRESDIVLYRNPEWQAWRFAGALLMPAPAFEEAVRSGVTERDLSQRFGVNPKFVKTRLKSLKLKL